MEHSKVVRLICLFEGVSVLVMAFVDGYGLYAVPSNLFIAMTALPMWLLLSEALSSRLQDVEALSKPVEAFKGVSLPAPPVPVKCGWRHDWKAFMAVQPGEGKKVVRTGLECGRCGSRKNVVVSEHLDCSLPDCSICGGGS